MVHEERQAYLGTNEMSLLYRLYRLPWKYDTPHTLGTFDEKDGRDTRLQKATNIYE